VTDVTVTCDSWSSQNIYWQLSVFSRNWALTFCYVYSLHLFSYSLFFSFLCRALDNRLSWPFHRLLSAYKSTVSYRIVTSKLVLRLWDRQMEINWTLSTWAAVRCDGLVGWHTVPVQNTERAQLWLQFGTVTANRTAF